MVTTTPLSFSDFSPGLIIMTSVMLCPRPPPVTVAWKTQVLSGIL